MHASITWCVCVCFITAVDAKSRPLHKLQCSRNSLGSCRQVDRENAIVGVLPPSWQPGYKPCRQKSNEAVVERGEKLFKRSGRQGARIYLFAIGFGVPTSNPNPLLDVAWSA